MLIYYSIIGLLVFSINTEYIEIKMSYLPVIVKRVTCPSDIGFYKSEDGTHFVFATTPFDMFVPEGVTATQDFTLKDLVYGKTYILGKTAKGCIESGVYEGMEQGKFLRRAGPSSFLLWSNFAILKGPWVDKHIRWYQKEVSQGYGSPKNRIEAAAEQGYSGYPDVKFWLNRGIHAPFVLQWWEFNGPNGSQGKLDIDEKGKLLNETLKYLQTVDTDEANDPIHKDAITKQIKTIQLILV